MEPFFFFNRRRFFPLSTPELQCGKQACVRSVKNVSIIFNTIHREPNEKKIGNHNAFCAFMFVGVRGEGARK